MARKTFRCTALATVVVAGLLSAPAPAAADSATDTLEKLDTLAVKGRAPKTGYDRDLFGQRWTDDVTVDDGHNGCDTRNDMLRRDLVDVVIRPGSNGCTVLSGVLDDPYTGSVVPFLRGPGTSADVQIDHVVALSDAWQKGAGDAATWLPPNRSYRCTYVSRIVDVKAAYGLWVTDAERDAIARVLADC